MYNTEKGKIDIILSLSGNGQIFVFGSISE